MTTRKALDLLLAEALENLQAAAGVARAIPNFDANAVLRAVGDATVRIWDVRETLHTDEPSLKPEFLDLYDSDRELCDRLFDHLQSAEQAEDQRDKPLAKRLYEELLETSPLRFFKTHAQAGLYRLTLW